MSTKQMERALQRSLNFEDMSADDQWVVDQELDLLDWSPDEAEFEEYLRRRAVMGDKACAKMTVKSPLRKMRLLLKDLDKKLKKVSQMARIAIALESEIRGQRTVLEDEIKERARAIARMQGVTRL